MSEELDRALKLLEKAETDYRESLDEVHRASNTLYSSQFLCKSRFDKVIALRKEVRKNTPIGHAFASFVNLTRENEKLKAENESIKDELRERVLELSSLSEKYEALKDEADWRFGHSVERGERE